MLMLLAGAASLRSWMLTLDDAFDEEIRLYHARNAIRRWMDYRTRLVGRVRVEMDLLRQSSEAEAETDDVAVSECRWPRAPHLPRILRIARVYSTYLPLSLPPHRLSSCSPLTPIHHHGAQSSFCRPEIRCRYKREDATYSRAM